MSLSQLASTVQTIRPDTSLSEAAHIMARDSVGALLIREEKLGPLEGILTDRDIVKEIAEGCDPKRTTVARFLGRPVTTLAEGSTRSEITSSMRVHGIRRIPLVDSEGRVTRIVALDDLLIEIGQEMFDIARAIRVEFQHEASAPDPDE